MGKFFDFFNEIYHSHILFKYQKASIGYINQSPVIWILSQVTVVHNPAHWGLIVKPFHKSHIINRLVLLFQDNGIPFIKICLNFSIINLYDTCMPQFKVLPCIIYTHQKDLIDCAPTHLNQKLENCFSNNEREKKRSYGQSVSDVEHGSFTPLHLFFIWWLWKRGRSIPI